MWICFNDGFVSAVQDPLIEDGLMVRARKGEHLKVLFPDETVFVGEGTDYKYRVYVSKKAFAQVVADRAANIDYTNFKDSVEDDQLHALYERFWLSHLMYQMGY